MVTCHCQMGQSHQHLSSTPAIVVPSMRSSLPKSSATCTESLPMMPLVLCLPRVLESCICVLNQSNFPKTKNNFGPCVRSAPARVGHHG